MSRFEVVDMVSEPGWVMVGDMSRPNFGPAIALFMVEFREIAQEMADRLNVRVAAGKMIACPTCSRPVDEVDQETGQPTRYVHRGPGGTFVHRVA